jgi:hypothetical protein
VSKFPIIDKLGGPSLVSDELTRQGLKRSTDAVRMWEVRGQISGPSIVALMQIAERKRVRYKAKDFLANGKSR